jgi:hypothetical protein
MEVIIYTNENGNVSVCVPTGELPIEQVQIKDTPPGSIIVDSETLPNAYNDFFDAWELNDGVVVVNLTKAKAIGHGIRRAARAEEFKPHDEVIMKQIPGNDYTQAEAARQAIREKYEEIQTQIDAAQTPEEIKTALGI